MLGVSKCAKQCQHPDMAKPTLTTVVRYDNN